MINEAQNQSQGADIKVANHTVSGESVVGFAVLGCLVTGAIALFKGMDSDGVGAGVCLLAAVAAFGTVCFIYFRKG